jgi:hypothetical protein
MSSLFLSVDKKVVVVAAVKTGLLSGSTVVLDQIYCQNACMLILFVWKNLLSFQFLSPWENVHFK